MTDLKNKVWAGVWPLSNEPLTYLCYSCFGTSGVFSCATCGSKGFLGAKDIAAIKRGWKVCRTIRSKETLRPFMKHFHTWP